MTNATTPTSPFHQAKRIARETGDIALVVEAKRNGAVEQRVIPIANHAPQYLTVVRIVFPENHKGGSHARRKKSPRST